MSLKTFNALFWRARYRLSDFRFANIGCCIRTAFLCLFLCFFCLSALADGADLLQGTDASAWATLTGTGKKYIYMIEFVLAIASYMSTRKLIVFTGFVVVSVAINIVLHFAGQS